MKLSEEQKDVLLAGAIGDAIGYLVEFNKINQIYAYYGPQGLHIKQIQPDVILTVSDDTQMTLFALEALHRTNPWERRIGLYREAFVQWLRTQHNPGKHELTSPLAVKFGSLHVQRAPGGTCLSALQKKGEITYPINDSKGCGGIMRAAPFAFTDSLEYAVMHGITQAQSTHGNPSGYVPAGFFAGLLHLALKGETLDNAIKKVIDLFDNATCDFRPEETIDFVTRAINTAGRSEGDHVADVHYIGGGWMGHDALAIAIYSVMVAWSFEECLSISINHNGDSDSTGSLAAQLWVALHGLPEAYRDWGKRLDIADAFEYALDENNYK